MFIYFLFINYELKFKNCHVQLWLFLGESNSNSTADNRRIIPFA
jgi:hypothetical protein